MALGGVEGGGILSHGGLEGTPMASGHSGRIPRPYTWLHPTRSLKCLISSCTAGADHTLAAKRRGASRRPRRGDRAAQQHLFHLSLAADAAAIGTATRSITPSAVFSR
jgi:hypothetical protein